MSGVGRPSRPAVPPAGLGARKARQQSPSAAAPTVRGKARQAMAGTGPAAGGMADNVGNSGKPLAARDPRIYAAGTPQHRLGAVADFLLPDWTALDELAQDRRAEWRAAPPAARHALWHDVAHLGDRAMQLASQSADALAPVTRELVRGGLLPRPGEGSGTLRDVLSRLARGLAAAHQHAAALGAQAGLEQLPSQLQGLCDAVGAVGQALVQLEAALAEDA
ncbi:MAG: hypothetical protein V4609_05490 [Pseudomonadota bacterium]